MVMDLVAHVLLHLVQNSVHLGVQPRRAGDRYQEEQRPKKGRDLKSVYRHALFVVPALGFDRELNAFRSDQNGTHLGLRQMANDIKSLELPAELLR